MPQIVTFIGWHNSGKTTLATQVVKHLKADGYRVGVIKSSKETGIFFDAPGTDTDKYRQAGADGILFVAPDQMVLMRQNDHLPLATLACRYFPDVDIVIGEGFKTASHVAKIEVVRDSAKLMLGKVDGIIAVATDQDIACDRLFALDESRGIASFIKERFLMNSGKNIDKTVLLVNDRMISLKESAREALAGTVAGFVNSLILTEDAREIELRITFNR